MTPSGRIGANSRSIRRAAEATRATTADRSRGAISGRGVGATSDNDCTRTASPSGPGWTLTTAVASGSAVASRAATGRVR